MQKIQFKLQLDAAVSRRLSEIADRYGMSANAIVAAAAYELSRVHPENLWHSLGRICEGENVPTLPEPERPEIKSGKAKKELKIAT